ncbi:odorant receptor 85a [Drosophila ficusphila]|uniref:odorant receptor 85a n=1 Tax=Drosophila ficusphila TaxID=30025 RepID=UPI0007E5DDA9|nr:odorant receptor 85a [Drosophila ficusphila]
MIFKYIQEPTIGALFRSRDSLIYLHRSMSQLGWRLPPRSKPFWWLYYLWCLAVIVLVFIFIPYGLIMTGVREFKNFTTTDLFTYVQVPVNTNASIMKGIIVLFMRGRFLQAQKMMDQMDVRCTRMEEKVQVHRSAALGNRVVVIYHGIYFGYLTMATTAALVIGKTPFCLYNPLVNPNEHFYLATTIECVTMAGIILANLILDVYPIIYVVILRTHLELLSQRVKNLRSDPDKDDDQHYAELTECVKDHKLIVEYGNSLRPMISATMFIQLLSVGLLLGLAAVSMQFYNTILERVVSGVYTIAILTQTFPFCYVCEQLSSDCESLSNTLFHSKWIGAERRYRTTMLYFIHNVQQSILFTAGGIFPICLNTNIKMAKFAFSVVTIVNEMDLAEKLRRE